ncbi:MAG TPA: hypothetical protein VGD01_14225 [Candidatus Elarobacter sp.]
MTEDYIRRRREVSISDYCFMIDPESVLTDRGGYRYLAYAPGSPASGAARARRAVEHVIDDSVSDMMRDLIACALAVLFLGMLAGAVWYAYFFPNLAT